MILYCVLQCLHTRFSYIPEYSQLRQFYSKHYEAEMPNLRTCDILSDSK
jgi:hypothetical protein